MLTEHSIEACARYIVDCARHVIESFGPRAPGSEAERRTQAFIKDELAAFCDGDVWLEPFPVAGKAFFSMHAIAASLLVISIVLWRLHPALSVALDVLAMSVWYFQLGRYRLFLDPFFAKTTSCNVYGRIKPRGPIRRRMILSGHADAACEFRFAYLAPRLFRYITMALLAGLAGLVAFHLLAFAAWVAGGRLWAVAEPLGALHLLAIPAILPGVFYNRISRIVPGANDNLSGAFAAVGIAKHLRESGVQMENTELGIAILGSEEAGLRGAKAFAKKHKAQFSDVETIFVALETFHDAEHFTVYNRDMNGTVKHDPEACRLFQEAGRQCGLELPYGSVYLGSSDASAFTQAGWRATHLAAMDPAPPEYYHTRRDNWDNMNKECLCKAVAITCAALQLYDGQATASPPSP